MKWLVVLALLAIFFSLGSALFYMIRDKGKTDNMFRFLALRVGLSITLFIFVIVASRLGWIESSSQMIK
jgi:hypothetical protein